MTVSPSEILALRAPRPTDVEALGQVCYDAFEAINARHGFPSDFPSVEMAAGLVGMLQTVPGVEGVVAERDGRPIGSAYLWADGKIGGIGPVTVAPEAQDGNVGKRLIRWTVERGDELGLKGQRLVQAAFHGRSMALYTKLGFEVKEPLAVMQGTLDAEVAGREVRPLTEADLDAANALCLRVHGIVRAGELMGATMRGEARGVFADERLTGYATTVGFFGHAVAQTNDDLLAMVAAGPISGPGILVPTRNTDLFRSLLEGGLRIVYPATLMARGMYREPEGAFLPSILY